MSPDTIKVLATFLSWAIMAALIAIVVGVIIFVFESAVTVQIGFITTGFSEWFTGLFALSIGLGLLTIGIMVSGIFLLSILITILIKNGQKFLMNIITRIED